MKFIKLIFMLVIIMGFVASAHSKNILPYEIKQHTFNNGLNLVVIPYNSPGVVAYYTVVRTGSRNEVEPGKTGFAHFFEHMMFRGTEKYSDIEYNRVLKLLGADSNAFTSLDLTAYHIVASADALETIIDIESDRFQNLKYSKEQFQTEAGAILGEYNKSAMSPYLIMNEEMSKLAFTTHTYRHTTIGFLEDIKDMPNQYDYSLQFFAKYYRPEYCTIVIGGDVNFEKAKSLVEKYYGNWKPGSFVPNIPKEPEQTSERTKNVKAPHKTLPYLYVSYKVPEFNDISKDVAALNVISRLLFAETSDLYQKLVLDEKLVDFVSGSMPMNRDPSLFRIYARVKKDENVEKVKNEILDAIEMLKREQVSPKKLNDVKSNIRYSFIQGLDNPDDIASTIAYFVNLTNDPNSVNHYYESIASVTPEDIMSTAKKYFGSESRNIILLTSGGN